MKNDICSFIDGYDDTCIIDWHGRTCPVDLGNYKDCLHYQIGRRLKQGVEIDDIGDHTLTLVIDSEERKDLRREVMPFAMIVDWVEIYSRGRYRFIELSSDGDIINLLRWNPPLLDKSERAKMLTKDIRKLVGNED